MTTMAKSEDLRTEKTIDSVSTLARRGTIESINTPLSVVRFAWQKLIDVGVEVRGLEPIPVEGRTDRRYVNKATIFAASMISLLPIGIGIAPTLVYGLPFSHAAAIIVGLNFVLILPSAYIMTVAPKTGMRQMVQARYSFGKYFNAFNSLTVTIGTAGFGVIACCQGAQVLTSLSPEDLPIAGSISIIMIVGLVLSFMGYHVLHFFARWVWIVTLFAVLVLVGSCGDLLHHQAQARAEGPKPYTGMVALSAANMLSWVNIIGDYAVYMPPEAPTVRLICYVIGGLAVPFTLLELLGAAIGGATPVISTWALAYQTGGFGNVVGSILTERLGNFGKFILVILAFSVVTTVARDLYTISFTVPIILPPLRAVPRIVWPIVATGVMIGVAVAAVGDFLDAVSSFLHILGYITGSSVTIYLVEWFYFRKADPANMDPAIWDTASALPSGVAAAAAIFVPWALIVPGMQSAWYVGPIAEKAGDLGFEFALGAALLIYGPVRALEIRFRRQI